MTLNKLVFIIRETPRYVGNPRVSFKVRLQFLAKAFGSFPKLGSLFCTLNSRFQNIFYSPRAHNFESNLFGSGAIADARGAALGLFGKNRVGFSALANTEMLNVPATSLGKGTCPAGDSFNLWRNLTAGGQGGLGLRGWREVAAATPRHARSATISTVWNYR